MDRAVFLEVLKDSYSAYYNIFPAEEGEAPLAFRAEYIRRDERYWLTKSIKIWANETNEFAYVFSAESYDVETVKRLKRLCPRSSRIKSTSVQMLKSSLSPIAWIKTLKST